MTSSAPLVECVPNFSEGRDQTIIRQIRDAVVAVPEVVLLGCESDVDHNRTVLTFAGPPDPVRDAALRSAWLAAQYIDLTRHKGVHPRIGAADVIPFIPLRNFTMAATVALARSFAEELWTSACVPSYLYEFAAARPERQQLESFRKLGFERVGTLLPDIGGPALHPTAGASAVGARRILIACNVNLATQDLDLAKRIARKIRASSGGFAYVKALAFPLPSRQLVQVSLNLTRYSVTPLRLVYDEILREASLHGAAVAETELIGFVPQAVVNDTPAFFAKCRDFAASRVLETHLGGIDPAQD